MYLQGLSSSLPEDVQLAFIHTIKGLEHAQVMRAAYAIEYDCVDPTALKATLEFLDIPGFTAQDSSTVRAVTRRLRHRTCCRN